MYITELFSIINTSLEDSKNEDLLYFRMVIAKGVELSLRENPEM